MTNQVIAEGGTDAEHRDEPAAQSWLPGQHGKQLSADLGRRPVHDPFDRREREVGIGGPRKLHQDGVTGEVGTWGIDGAGR